MQITSAMVKELRDKTSAGMMDCKKALDETNGDMEKAVDFLRQKGLAVAAKRADRDTSEGVIATYIHSGGKLGVMVELACETDFVAKTDQFIDFGKELAMHIAATNPISVSRDEVPAEVLEREKAIYIQQALDSGKPQNIAEKMVTGRVEKFLAEIVLLEQKFIKDPDHTIQEVMMDLVGKLGENITVKRFSRFQIGA